MSTTFRPARRALLAFALAAPFASFAQSWPAKPIRIVVPVPPGGSLDILARTLAKELTPRLGQSVLVENVPGAGGNIAFAQVANAAPDGYTVLHGWDPLVINPALFRTVPYSLGQLAPVTLAITSPQVLAVNPSRVQAATLQTFVAAAAKQPARFNVASPGNGSPGHLALSLLEKTGGIELVHVPYKGGGPAIADLIAGHLDAAIVTLPAALQQVKGGRLRALGVTTRERATGAKDIPTFAEGGLRGYELTSWQGFFVPSGTSKDVVGRLNAEIVAVLGERHVRDQLVAQGFDIVASSPEALAREVERGTPRWAALVRDAHATVD